MVNPRDVISDQLLNSDIDYPTADAVIVNLAKHGFSIVPRTPTPEMKAAGDEFTHCGGSCGNRSSVTVWHTMMAKWFAEMPLK